MADADDATAGHAALTDEELTRNGLDSTCTGGFAQPGADGLYRAGDLLEYWNTRAFDVPRRGARAWALCLSLAR